MNIKQKINKDCQGNYGIGLYQKCLHCARYDKPSFEVLLEDIEYVNKITGVGRFKSTEALRLTGDKELAIEVLRLSNLAVSFQCSRFIPID